MHSFSHITIKNRYHCQCSMEDQQSLIDLKQLKYPGHLP